MTFIETEKANESRGHAYAHLPTTMIRFFTVYGPWGRPDLALYKFVDAILDGRPIDIYTMATCIVTSPMSTISSTRSGF